MKVFARPSQNNFIQYPVTLIKNVTFPSHTVPVYHDIADQYIKHITSTTSTPDLKMYPAKSLSTFNLKD